jgi:DegV family protein with EDD domain
MTVGVVTDSTAYLPDAVVESMGLYVVPLTIVVSGQEGREGLDIRPDEVAQALGERRVAVTTSRPTPAEFDRAYRTLLDAGATGVVSVHLSARLSGTVDSAMMAAGEFGGRVRVIDARSAGMAVGFAAMAACQAAQADGDLDAVEQAAISAAEQTHTWFYVDTLEFLRRGGRIGAASAFVGTALSVKPILHMVSGEVVLKEKVRTAGRALARLADLAVEAAETGTGVSGESTVDIAIQHLGAVDRAEALRDTLIARLGPLVRDTYLTEVGAALAAHTGPGIIAVALHRRG